MRFFTNKSIWSKIIIILIFVLLFEFVVAKPSLGAEVTSEIVEGGGVLLKPIMSLVVTLGDAIMSILGDAIMGNNATTMPVDVGADFWTIIGRAVLVIAAVVAAVAAIAVTVATGGISTAIIAPIAGTLLKAVAATTIGWFALPIATGSADATISNVSASVFSDDVKVPATLILPAFDYTPEQIFEGKILLFNVDFFGEQKTIYAQLRDEDGNDTTPIPVSDKEALSNAGGSVAYYYYLDTDENGNEVKVATSRQNVGSDLSLTISKWYVSIRNIALVCMMIVLLYIGIRMLISTLASDKAKYRQMLQDWLVGVVILFLMHYIMAFSVTLVQQLTKIVSSSIDENVYAVRFPVDEGGMIVDWFNENNMEYMLCDESGNILGDESGNDVDKNQVAYVLYPTNLLGSLRLSLQFDVGSFKYVGYAICYLVLVFFTLYFTFVYLKRVLYMAFLTLIAPVVAVTYPIDKINDGSAQGFQRWFREYIFNLLIQPMHLLLYFILITSAFGLAGENVIYSIVAIAFMVPAEKLLRSLFGFEKASTPGVLNGVAGGALAMNLINKIGSRGSRGRGSGDRLGSGGSSDQNSNERIPKMNGTVDTNAHLLEMASGSSNGEENTSQQNYRNEQLQMLQDDLDSEGITPQDAEYAQMVRGRGFTPEDLDNFNKEKQESLNINNGNSGQVEGTQGEEEQAIPEPNSTIRMARISEPQTPQVPQNGQDNTNKPTSGIKRKLKRVAGATGAVMKYKAQARAQKNADFARRLPGNVIKYAKKGAIGAAVGGVGLAAGVATGDPSNALAYTAAGATAGASLVGNSNGQGISPETRAVWNRAYNSKEYEDLQRQEYMSNFKKKNKEALERNFDKKQVEEMMQTGGSLEQYLNNNVTNIDDIITAETMRLDSNVSQVKTVNDAITIAKFSKNVGGNYKGPEGDEWKKSLADSYVEEHNMKRADANRAAGRAMKLAEKFDKTKKGIYR